MIDKHKIQSKAFKSQKILDFMNVLLDQEIQKLSKEIRIPPDQFQASHIARARHNLAYRLGHRKFSNMYCRLRLIPDENMDLLLRGDHELEEKHIRRDMLSEHYTAQSGNRSKEKGKYYATQIW